MSHQINNVVASLKANNKLNLQTLYEYNYEDSNKSPIPISYQELKENNYNNIVEAAFNAAYNGAYYGSYYGAYFGYLNAQNYSNNK